MIHLYVKQHNLTGLKYFGRTYRNPFEYKGSGTFWKRHIKKHGNDVSTGSVWSYHDNQFEEACSFALEYSEQYDIVASPEWANLIVENVKDGNHKGVVFTPEQIERRNAAIRTSGYKHSEEARAKISKAKKGSKRTPEQCIANGLRKRGLKMSDTAREKMSLARKGKQLSEYHKQRIREARLATPIIMSAETKAKMSAAKKGKTQSPEHIAKRFATIKANRQKPCTKCEGNITKNH